MNGATPRIEDYALIGDMHSAGLVSRAGSLDWLCLPRFDSAACFAALLGSAENGRWLIAPQDEIRSVERRYRPGTLVLETTFRCDGGEATLVDCMVLGAKHPCVVRVVRGDRGRVAMHAEYVLRCDYGRVVPWMRQIDRGLLGTAGPDTVLLRGDLAMRADGMRHVAEFEVLAGDELSFTLSYAPSHAGPPPSPDPDPVERTERAWHRIFDAHAYHGPYADAVARSTLTLLALAYRPTGGIVAAPTTSLPESIGGARNWDYRYCWLRDATFTIYALLTGGHVDTAVAWRAWLLRAVAGDPDCLQILYGIRGHRRLPEVELPWLDGFAQSKPVRIGNEAAEQFQLDVYGEVIDLLFTAHRFGIKPTGDDAHLGRDIVGVVERRWREPDRGMWEVRGGERHFTHSKVMAWVALDRGVKAVERFGVEGPVERWRALREVVHAEVCERAFSTERNAFVQSYGSRALDASALLIPIVGFLPCDDPRVVSTVAAIERDLVRDGFVYRYDTGDPASPDDLPSGEGAFLACSFWLADNYVLAKRHDEARALFERVASVANDVGLMAEEYDPRAGRMLGNFPQAFSHVGLINTAYNIWHHTQPAAQRGA